MLPSLLGFEHPADLDHRAGRRGSSLGAADRRCSRAASIAYLGIPAFIVTLGGLLVWRGAAWWVTAGQTVAPMDTRFAAHRRRRRGLDRRHWSWVVGRRRLRGIIVGLGCTRRRRRQRFSFPLRPVWAEVVSSASSPASPSSARVRIANAYPWPAGIARALCAEANGITVRRKADCSSPTGSPSRC